MNKVWIILSILIGLNASIKASDGHRISIELENYTDQELYLGYFYGDKQYSKDTAQINADGAFVFEGEEKLEGGVYLVIMAPDNNFFQILIDSEDQHFKLKTDSNNPNQKMVVEGSINNDLFFKYLGFLAKKRPEADQARKELEAANDAQKTEIQKRIDQIDNEVATFQSEILINNPGSLISAIIKANLPLNTPEFEGEEREVKRWRWTQKHYWDNLDLGNPSMLRTPFLFQRVDHFVHKLQVQHPDSIAQAIGYVLDRMRPAEETFKYYLIHFLNKYAQSKIVGMDAVYVYIVEKYYETGYATWTDEEQLKKIIDNAKALKPLLIGKTAPDIQLQRKDGSKISLHEVDAEYTILYFWRYDCGHCKKSMPDMKAFYGKFKDKGVKLFAVCTKFTEEVPPCWEYIEENGIEDWIHVVDPYHRSKFSKIYNIKSTPQLYILDNKKEILSKRIGAEQLEEVMDQIIEMRNKAKELEETR